MTATGARSPAADPALVARFKEALERLWPDGERLGLAVSGGPDSLAMLLLTEAAIPGQFEVATVDHGLRPEAVAECAMVAEICAERGIPCEVLSVAVVAGNLQASARRARYSALSDWARHRGMSAIATAHHVDDQVETLLMRLNRGSGVAGLAGVRERGAIPESGLPLIRPLLAFRRAELAPLLLAARLDAVSDPSNMDDRFDRVRLRKAIKHADWLDPEAVARSAANLADADEAIAWAARREWGNYVTGSADRLTYRAGGAPRAVVLRILEYAFESFGSEPRGGELANLLDRLVAGQGGNLGGVAVRVQGPSWVFRPEPPRRSG